MYSVQGKRTLEISFPDQEPRNKKPFEISFEENLLNVLRGGGIRDPSEAIPLIKESPNAPDLARAFVWLNKENILNTRTRTALLENHKHASHLCQSISILQKASLLSINNFEAIINSVLYAEPISLCLNGLSASGILCSENLEAIMIDNGRHAEHICSKLIELSDSKTLDSHSRSAVINSIPIPPSDYGDTLAKMNAIYQSKIKSAPRPLDIAIKMAVIQNLNYGEKLLQDFAKLHVAKILNKDNINYLVEHVEKDHQLADAFIVLTRMDDITRKKCEQILSENIEISSILAQILMTLYYSDCLNEQTISDLIKNKNSIEQLAEAFNTTSEKLYASEMLHSSVKALSDNVEIASIMAPNLVLLDFSKSLNAYTISALIKEKGLIGQLTIALMELESDQTIPKDTREKLKSIVIQNDAKYAENYLSNFKQIAMILESKQNITQDTREKLHRNLLQNSGQHLEKFSRHLRSVMNHSSLNKLLGCPEIDPSISILCCIDLQDNDILTDANIGALHSTDSRSAQKLTRALISLKDLGQLNDFARFVITKHPAHTEPLIRYVLEAVENKFLREMADSQYFSQFLDGFIKLDKAGLANEQKLKSLSNSLGKASELAEAFITISKYTCAVDLGSFISNNVGNELNIAKGIIVLLNKQIIHKFDGKDLPICLDDLLTRLAECQDKADSVARGIAMLCHAKVLDIDLIESMTKNKDSISEVLKVIDFLSQMEMSDKTMYKYIIENPLGIQVGTNFIRLYVEGIKDLGLGKILLRHGPFSTEISNFLIELHQQGLLSEERRIEIKHHQMRIVEALRETLVMKFMRANWRESPAIDIYDSVVRGQLREEYEKKIDVHNLDELSRKAVATLIEHQGQVDTVELNQAFEAFESHLEFMKEKLPGNIYQKAVFSLKGQEHVFTSIVETENFSPLMITGKNFIARIWIFAQGSGNDLENIKQSMINGLAEGVFLHDVTKTLAHLCPQGKLNRLVITCLQGRLKGVDLEEKQEITEKYLINEFFSNIYHQSIESKVKLMEAVNKWLEERSGIEETIRNKFIAELEAYSESNGLE